MTSSVQAPPIEFRISLPEILLFELVRVLLAPIYEGYSKWVYTTHAALSPVLKAELAIVRAFIVISGTFFKWLDEFPEDDPIRRDFSTFVSRLESLTAEDFHEFLRSGLELKSRFNPEESSDEISLPSLDDAEAVKTLLEKLDLHTETLQTLLQEAGSYGEFTDSLISLICNPARLKERFLSGIVGFGEGFFCEEYERVLPIMERSVKHHRSQNYTDDFPTVFKAITGREYLDELNSYFPTKRIVFYPSYHGGPQVGGYVVEERPTLLFLTYNCRLTGMQKDDSAG